VTPEPDYLKEGCIENISVFKNLRNQPDPAKPFILAECLPLSSHIGII